MPIQVNASGNQDIDGLLWGYKWDFTNLTYGVPDTTAAYAGYGLGAIVGFESLHTPQYLKLINGIIHQYDSVCGLSFTLINDADVANIRYAKVQTIDVGDGRGAHTPGGGSAECIPPDPSQFPAYAQGDAWFSYRVTAPPPIGSFQYTAWLLHEAGHGLGLKHGHVEQAGHGVNFPALPGNHNSQEYSVMTYQRYPGDPLNNEPSNVDFDHSDYPTTLMQDDIAALQYMYGADYTTNSGNTTYKWSTTNGQMLVNGVGQGIHFHHKVFLTIWDGGGVDTYDMSNYAKGVKIDLNPGAWSITSHAQLADLAAESPGKHLARGNIANALVDPNNPNETASLIENAIGGSGSDSITGNVVANDFKGGDGNDTIFGGAGQDTVHGEAGNDFIQGGFDVDLLDGGTGFDTIDFSYSSENWTINLGAGTAVPASAGTEHILNFENVQGSSGQDVMIGSRTANKLFGNGGNDDLSGGNGGDVLVGGIGTDKLLGGAAKDTLTGGKGADTSTGGAGADHFVFSAIIDTPLGTRREAITDFSHAQGDKIDLSALDAKTGLAGNQSFNFIGAAAFGHHAGELHFVIQGGNALVEGDTDGNAVANFRILLTGIASLVAGDFMV